MVEPEARPILASRRRVEKRPAGTGVEHARELLCAESGLRRSGSEQRTGAPSEARGSESAPVHDKGLDRDEDYPSPTLSRTSRRDCSEITEAYGSYCGYSSSLCLYGKRLSAHSRPLLLKFADQRPIASIFGAGVRNHQRISHNENTEEARAEKDLWRSRRCPRRFTAGQ